MELVEHFVLVFVFSELLPDELALLRLHELLPLLAFRLSVCAIKRRVELLNLIKHAPGDIPLQFLQVDGRGNADKFDDPMQKFDIVDPVADKQVGLLELPVLTFSLGYLDLVLSLASEHGMEVLVLVGLVLLGRNKSVFALLVGGHGAVDDWLVSGVVVEGVWLQFAQCPFAAVSAPLLKRRQVPGWWLDMGSFQLLRPVLHPIDGWPSLRVEAEHLAHEPPGNFWHTSYQLLQRLVHDLVVEYFFGHGSPWDHSFDHLEKNHPQRPNIATHAVIVVLEGLRRHVDGTANIVVLVLS